MHARSHNTHTHTWCARSHTVCVWLQVIAVARSADMILMVLDGAKEGGINNHRAILEKELETVGLRLNKTCVTLRQPLLLCSAVQKRYFEVRVSEPSRQMGCQQSRTCKQAACAC
jgi:hypothetical protein